MIYGYAVIKDGVLYEPGTDVPENSVEVRETKEDSKPTKAKKTKSKE